MVKSTCRSIAGSAVTIAVITGFLAYNAWQRIPRGYWIHPNVREPYQATFFTLLAIVTLSIIVAIGACRLGNASHKETILLCTKAIENEKKLDNMQKEIDSLREKIDVLREEINK